MDWMYKGPTALVDRKDYLLGRKVDKSFQQLEAQEKGGDGFSYADEVEKDLTPASIFSSRGSGAAGPVDIIRKIKEDPLYQIEKKEQETLKQLLQNPIKMKQLQKLAAQKQKETSKSKKHKRKHKKRRRSSSSSDGTSDSGSTPKKLDKSTIDRLLAAKLNVLKKKKSSRKKEEGSSSSDSSVASDQNERRGRGPSQSDKKISTREEYYRPLSERERPASQRNYSSSRDNRNDERNRGDRYRDERGSRDRRREDRFSSPPRRSGGGGGGTNRRDNYKRRSRSRSPQRFGGESASGRKESVSESQRSHVQEKRKPLSEEEMERRRREMMDNAKVRDEDRRKNVERWREEQKKEDEELAKQHDAEFIRKHLLKAAEVGSVEKRIKSNSYNIQKSSSSMNQNFARR